MVEIGLAPVEDGVALLAIVTETGRLVGKIGFVQILGVAVVTASTLYRELTVPVALIAFELGMDPDEGKAQLVMIEVREFPGTGIVA